MHGARSGAPTGKANGRWRHGLYCAEVVEARRIVNLMARMAREVV